MHTGRMQTPAPVDYARAHTVEEALELLERYGPESRLIAGRSQPDPDDAAADRPARDGSSTSTTSPSWTTSGLVGATARTTLAIGAMTRHRSVLESAVIGEHYAILHDAERVIADPIVRNRGTVGGSLCQADPAEDLSAVGRRAAGRPGPAVEPRLPRRCRPANSPTARTTPCWTTRRCSSRCAFRSGRAPAAPTRRSNAGPATGRSPSAGAYLVLDGDTVTDVGIGLAALGADHGCAPDAESYLLGKDLTDETIAEAGRLAAACSNPSADQRGPVVYKKHLADELTRRVLRRAAARAAGKDLTCR